MSKAYNQVKWEYILLVRKKMLSDSFKASWDLRQKTLFHLLSIVNGFIDFSRRLKAMVCRMKRVCRNASRFLN
ncbi:hypothetical protein E1A91_D03G119000v1 [Gossypium mustelinum]|uniref:Uncharacterized protein n=1 Tax=Gossypium mustelinum TaxID=34275 RepID=A0A5D2VMH2_GOSMU|nr:hypothetical protein E1A91_D03G119000v1 [Gossypium mustelinum]